jgi:DNA-binding NtrC family response regulator
VNELATILFVDDDPYIRKVLCACLKRAGFEVLCAADGADALKAARNFKGPIQLLISDVMMPGLQGPELAQELLQSRPEIKVLLISAAAAFPAPGDLQWKFLRKPFAPAMLLGKIQEMLPSDPTPAEGHTPDELLRHRMREARAEYVRYSQEYDLLLALTVDPAAAPPDRMLALRQAAEIRRSTLHAYSEAVRQFADFIRLRQTPNGPSAGPTP